MIRFSPALLAAALTTLFAAQAPAAVKISFLTKTVPFGAQTREVPVMEVNNGELSFDFSRNVFWTIREITFKGQVVGQASGGTGSVVTWDGKPVGTVHVDGDKHEYLTSVDLILDGKTIPLWADGKELFAEGDSYEGKNFELIKKSTLGPLKHQAHFTLKDGSNALTAVNDFEALEDIPADRFTGYRYVFMHMHPLSMTEWMRIDPDGTAVSGTTKDDPAKSNYYVFTLPARGLALYEPTAKIGIAYFYPPGFIGLTEYGLRPRKDSKYRAVLFDQDHYAKGDTRQWTLTLEPFSAPSDSWLKTATDLIAQGK